MTDNVICHYGFYCIGKVAGHPGPPTGFITKHGSVDGDGKILPCHDVGAPARAILPPLTESGGVFSSYKKRNARGPQIYAHPVNNPSSLLAWLQSLATIS